MKAMQYQRVTVAISKQKSVATKSMGIFMNKKYLMGSYPLMFRHLRYRVVLPPFSIIYVFRLWGICRTQPERVTAYASSSVVKNSQFSLPPNVLVDSSVVNLQMMSRLQLKLESLNATVSVDFSCQTVNTIHYSDRHFGPSEGLSIFYYVFFFLI